jgi:hypothetical protein
VPLRAGESAPRAIRGVCRVDEDLLAVGERDEDGESLPHVVEVDAHGAACRAIGLHSRSEFGRCLRRLFLLSTTSGDERGEEGGKEQSHRRARITDRRDRGRNRRSHRYSSI